MKQIDLGRSGLLGSEIALGCMRINKLSEKELDAYIRTALECGIDFFDHADIYGGGDCEAASARCCKTSPACGRRWCSRASAASVPACTTSPRSTS